MANIIEMPKLSDTMEVGTLITWLKKEGDAVQPGDMIAEVETDKATMELENFEEGILLKQYVKEGDEVPVGAPVCAVGEKGEKAPEAASSKGDSKASSADAAKAEAAEKKEQDDRKQAEPVAADKSAPQPPPSKESEEAVSKAKQPDPEAEGSKDASSDGERIKASPLARKLAEEKGIDLKSVKGTGPGGRIVREDINAAIERGANQPATTAGKSTAAAPAPTGAGIGGEDKVTKVSNMRGAIARRLLESKTQIPHFYLEMEVDAGPLVALRESLNGGLADLKPEQGGTKFTVNDFILKATIEALRRVPTANASWQGDKIVQYGAVHLAFAVAVEEGLVTPTIRDAHNKGLRQVSAEARELIDKARKKKLKPDEMSGSTFTITNLGMYGIRNFYGIINPPNGAILSVGATVKKPVVDKNDNIVVGQRMSLGLSGDHRVVDGAVAAEFLVALRSIIENPSVMLV